MKRREIKIPCYALETEILYREVLPGDPDPEAVDAFIAAFDRYLKSDGKWPDVVAARDKLERGGE